MAKAEMTVLRVAKRAWVSLGRLLRGIGETAAGGGTHQDQACIDPTTGFMTAERGPTKA